MNIFEQYLYKIKEILSTLSSNGDLILPDSLNGITAEIPPSKFDSDISTNVAMVLSKINFQTYPSLEAQVSAISDDIAYNNHDIQDGINANLFKLEELIEINFFKDIYKKYKKKINKQNYKIATYQIIRDSIDQMIRDLIKNTKTNLKINRIKNYKDITKANLTMVDFSEKVKDSVNEIRFFLKTKMYNNKAVLKKNDSGKLIIKKLFNKIQKNPKKFISKNHLSKDKYRAISDFISGMTDRYAINLHKNFK